MSKQKLLAFLKDLQEHSAKQDSFNPWADYDELYDNLPNAPNVRVAHLTLKKEDFLIVPRVGLDVNFIYVTYLLKSRPLRKYDKAAARKASYGYLIDQLAKHNPEIVLCLGNVVVQSYFNNEEATVKELRGHSYIINNKKTIVSYHPLAVRRRPVLYKYFLEDWSLVVAQLT